MSSTQRIDYVRQNIEKFGKKSTSKTPIRTNLTNNLIKRSVNDENLKPTDSKVNLVSNSALKSVSKSVPKGINSLSKVNSKVSSSIKKSADQPDKFDRKQTIKTNLINKINKNNILATKNQLINNNDKQNLKTTEFRRLSNERRVSNERLVSNERRVSNERLVSNECRVSNEKATDKQLKIINEKTDDDLKQTDKQNQKTLRDNKQIKCISVSNEKLNDKPNQQVKQSAIDKPIRTLAINEDLNKNRLIVENNLLKLKYLNSKCETKLRKQNQNVIDIVRSIFNLIESKRANCLQLEQQFTHKETLLFLLKLSEENLKLLEDVDLNKLEFYLNLVSNIINSVLSSVKVVDLKNAENINDILKLTVVKLASDLKMDTVQEFTDKINQFDSINQEIFETFEIIRSLKSNLIDELNRRTELKNIY